MTETLLALVPTYGIWLVMASVALSCLAVPVPSSILVMAAGGFAAAGDLVLWQLVLCAWIGFVAGDQIAYGLARRGGPSLVARVRRRPRAASVLGSAERLIERFGVMAVFLSRTVLSPVGPYVSFLSGALRLGWLRYSVASALGAVVWSCAYAALGHVFVGRIAEIAPLIGNAVGLLVAGSAVVALGLWIARSGGSVGGRG